VEYAVQEQAEADSANAPVAQAERVTYGQDWPMYNAAQTNERDWFNVLLHDLSMGIPQPPQTFGRPRLALSDVVFTVVAKVYSTMSGRRFTCDLRTAQEREFIDKAPHYNSAFRYLESPSLTPLLKHLIEETAKPLKEIETNFSADSSGFSTCVYDRWFDERYGKMRSENKWLTLHVMTGAKTHVVTSVLVTPTRTADAPQFPGLVTDTARNFRVREVSADKAYSSRQNLHAVEAVGGTAYIPFKRLSRGTQGQRDFDSLWDRMWHFYTFNRAEFMEHYHKRSNIETSLSMVKRKFGTFVRSKSPDAQVNEVLCKVLCHNICVLIQSIYELKLEPIFWQEQTTNRN
jgi:transposase